MTTRSLVLVLVAHVAVAVPGTAVAAPDPERSPTVSTATGGTVFVGTDAKKMFSEIHKIKARVTAVDVEVRDGRPVYALGYAANTGAMARTWWWDPLVTEATLFSRLKARNARLVDLAVFTINGKRRLSAVSVKNEGAAAKSWWWHPRVERSEILPLTKKNSSRVVDLERGRDGRYDVVAIANTGEDARAWSIFYGLRSIDVGRNAAVAAGDRVLDIEYAGRGERFGAKNEHEESRFDVVTVASPEKAGGWFFAARDSAAIAARRTRSFGGRAAAIEFFRDSRGRARIAHVGVSDIDPVSEGLRDLLAGDRDAYSQSGPYVTDEHGLLGFFVRRGNDGATLAALNPTLRHESASALKPLHVAAVAARYDTAGRSVTTADDFSYKQYIGTPSCPDDDVASKTIVKRSFREAAVDTLVPSDNGATAALLTRAGGRTALTAFARSLGMAGLQLGASLGCFSREKPNLWTLMDSSRMWGRIASRTATPTPTYGNVVADALINESSTVRNWYRMAADAAGKGNTPEALALVEFRVKGGAYGQSSSRTAIRTMGGYLRLPVMVNGALTTRTYTLGSFWDSRRGIVPPRLADGPTGTLAPVAFADALATFD